MADDTKRSHPDRYYDDGPGYINTKTGFRVATTEEVEEAHKKIPRTKGNSHRATAKGYAVPDNANGAGVLVEAGEIVPADVPIADEWMEKIGKKASAVDRAVEEALDPHPKDVDLTKLDKSALQAMAAERGINVDGLGPKDLITAINAARENDAG